MPSDERINIEIKAEVSLPPADELRMAAATLRELAAKATPGPWAVDWTHENEVRDASGDAVAVAPWPGIVMDDGDASWIATLSPAVAEPMATVLEAFTGPAENAGWIDGMTGFADLQAAVDLARKINRHRDEAS